MKITFEINVANKSEVLDAIETLSLLNPSVNVQEEKVITEVIDTKEQLHEEDVAIISEDILNGFDFNVNSSSAEEIDALKEEISRLKSEKKELKLQNKTLSDTVEKLETVVNATPQEPDTNDNTLEIDSLKQQIQTLTNSVAFHEGRSNKNFEEVKRLRNLVNELTVKNEELNTQLTEAKAKSNSVDSAEMSELKLSNVELNTKVESLESRNEKLKKEVEFQKTRSTNNWEELKELKNKFAALSREKEILEKEMESKSSNSNSEEVEKLKLDLLKVKSDYENTISELKLANDKLQNEVDLCKNKFNEASATELNHLREVKTVICSNERGAMLWSNVENMLSKQ